MNRQAISPLINRPAPGLVQLMVSYSISKTPMAALSRPVAGVISGSNTLVVTLPGSPRAVREGLEALAPVIGHALELLKGGDGKEVHREMGLKDRGAGTISWSDDKPLCFCLEFYGNVQLYRTSPLPSSPSYRTCH